jgi:hypothetical protein
MRIEHQAPSESISLTAAKSTHQVEIPPSQDEAAAVVPNGDGNGLQGPTNAPFSSNQLEGLTNRLTADPTGKGFRGKGTGSDAAGGGPGLSLSRLTGTPAVKVSATTDIDQKKQDYREAATHLDAVVESYSNSLDPRSVTTAETIKKVLGNQFEPGSPAHLLSLKLKVAAENGGPFLLGKEANTQRTLLEKVQSGNLTHLSFELQAPGELALAKELVAEGLLVQDEAGVYHFTESSQDLTDLITTLNVLADPDSEAGRLLRSAFTDYIQAEAALRALGIDPATVRPSAFGPAAVASADTEAITVAADDSTDTQLAAAMLFKQAMADLESAADTVSKGSRELDRNRAAAVRQKGDAASHLIGQRARRDFEEAEQAGAKHTDQGRAEALDRLTAMRKAAEAERAAP